MSLKNCDNIVKKIHQKLARLLNKLNFSDIRVSSMPDNPTPRPLALSSQEQFYPCVSASKNGYKYLFKTVANWPAIDDDDGLLKLKKVADNKDEDDNAQFVLVVPYGSKKNFERKARQYKVPLSDIWEISVY